MEKNKIVLYATRLLNAACVLCFLYLSWLLLQVTTYASFRIPTDSMVPTLLPGDNILVNKWVMGARIFNIWDMAEGKETEIHRLPGVRNVKRNDVLVFHNPYPITEDSLSMDLLKYYVKRCIGLPGDTVEIRDCRYRVNGTEGLSGHVPSQERLAAMDEYDLQYVCVETFPWDRSLGWTVREFGPLPVPSAGQVVRMDTTTVKLYRQLVEWEQKRKLEVDGTEVCLGDSVIREYRFKENYYFMAGDKVVNSRDSRYWGLLPESYIVGVATRIWKSVHPHTRQTRWERFWKKIE